MSSQVPFILSLGSNHRGKETMRLAQELLSGLLPGIRFTPMLENEAVDGGEGRYLNCLAKGSTPLRAGQLQQLLKQTERDCGDTREQRLQGRVVMDIDLLQLGTARYHERDWQRPYVKQLIQKL